MRGQEMKYVILIAALWCSPVYAATDGPLWISFPLPMFICGLALIIVALLYLVFCHHPLGENWICTKQVRISKEGDLPEQYESVQFTKKGYEK
jgi:hypothetical protein